MHVESGFLAKGNGFAQALHQAGDAHLVDHFGELAAARRAHEREGAREGHGHRAHAVEYGFVATAHDGEQAVLCAALATGYGRVNKGHALGFGGGIDLAGHVGRGGGVVDEDGALFHAGQGPVGAEDD